MSGLKRVIERYLLIWLVLTSGLAYWGDRLPVDVFAAGGGFLPQVIAVTMFAIGWMLPRDEVRQVIERWPAVLAGTAIQYTAMPALAYLLARQFELDGPLLIGVVMVGCVPGAMASNVLTLLAGGNTSYSVSLTTMATLASPVMVPLAMQATLGASVPPETIVRAAVQLTWMVLLPVAAGYTLSRLYPKHQATAQVVGSIVANLTILWIIAVVVALNRRDLAGFQAVILLVLLLLNMLGYLAGYAGGRMLRLPAGMRTALTLEVGMQNAGLGTALVRSLFPDEPQIAVPPALYTFGCMLTGTMLARFWQRRGNRDD